MSALAFSSAFSLRRFNGIARSNGGRSENR